MMTLKLIDRRVDKFVVTGLTGRFEMTASGAASVDKTVKVATFPFQWMAFLLRY